ncbi:dipeptidyl peptidase 9 [Metopolophium dirhodum]|uniref:dipeptidyl peptidase 9 n=1 Tax=Metopolophium dirhodum TaxID=44670 RepID=UPI00299015AC|nr:dipeptidyl peptidase 9 [Metopolophium dirhodum]
MLPNDQGNCSPAINQKPTDGDNNALENGHQSITNPGAKKTWSEIRQTVCDFRHRLSTVSVMSISHVSFRRLQNGKTRVYFLSAPVNEFETLLYVDLPNQSVAGQLPWQPLIESNFPSVIMSGRYSREEQLLSERKRLTTFGITSYEINSESGRIVFPAASTLFQCNDNEYSTNSLYPTELRTNAAGAKLSPQICPNNIDIIAYVCNFDIWVTHIATGSTKRLTYAHKGGRCLSDDPLAAGVPSYVMQEEFNRYHGYWWQPKQHKEDNVYRILYEEVDESEVKIFNFPSSNSAGSGEIEQYRFPRAGTANSKSNIKLVEFQLDGECQIINIKNMELQYPLAHMFPWMEYLVRVGWTPNDDLIWLQVLDRRQQRLELMVLSIDNFIEHASSNIINSSHNSTFVPPQVIYSQTSNVWVNVHDLLYMFPITSSSEVTMIWATEDTGFRHLYLITSIITKVSHENGIQNVDPSENNMMMSKLALTSGNWEVCGKGLWVDLKYQIVYFMAVRESPLEKHLYAVSLKSPGNIKLLTKPGYSYEIDIDKNCEICVAVYSNIRKPPSCQVFRIEHNDMTVDGIYLQSVGFLVENSEVNSVLQSPTLVTHQISSGDVLFAMVFKPHNFVPGQKYPTILHVYGGPEVQLVTNTFKGARHIRMHMLASQGYVVIAIDSRGSRHRGLIFESHLKGRLGTVELSDQIEVLQWLAGYLGYIDMNRLAIHGWSYGGYLSLMGLATYSNIFKLAIAGAPVTSWAMYDTGYTERYMDLPQYNSVGYMNGSVLSYVSRLPDEENRLLIIHGLIDENVHFSHTSLLINTLVKYGKPYQLQIYPNERHSLRSLDATKHYDATFLSFLQNYL